MVTRLWYCWHQDCGKAFVHARYLTGHLLVVHNELGPR